MNIKKYDPEKAGFKTWLTGITINKILMHKRKKVPVSYDIDLVHQHDLPTNRVQDVESNLDFKQLLSVIRNMPEKYQTVFNLSVLDGYSHNEIAEKLDITESASRVLLHRGREWAKQEVERVHAENTNLMRT